MTKLKLASKLPDCDKPNNLKSLRHRISKKEIEDYFNKEDDEE